MDRKLDLVAFWRRSHPQYRRIGRLLVGVLFLGVLAILARDFSVGSTARFLLSFFSSDSIFGVFAFTAAYVVLVLVLVPGALLTLTAGGLYGFQNGVLIVAISTTIADAVAFLLARYVFRSKVERLAKRYPQFLAFDRALTQRSWRLVALLRLNPTIPYSVSNYLFGVSGIRFLPYLIASGLFTLPGAIVYVYLGKNGVETLQGRTSTWSEWALFIVGLITTLIAIPYVLSLIRASFRKPSAEGLTLP